MLGSVFIIDEPVHETQSAITVLPAYIGNLRTVLYSEESGGCEF